MQSVPITTELGVRVDLWCLMSLSTIFQVMISFIGGGNQSTRRKPPTCHKSHKMIVIKEECKLKLDFNK
jgi:hypothetical protein